MTLFTPINEKHEELVSGLDETRECAMCGEETSQNSQPVYYKWTGTKHILESWKCGTCGLGGGIIRDLDGDIVRISHLHTGNGFQYPSHEVEEKRGGISVLSKKESGA
jgi:hypothetical protein